MFKARHLVIAIGMMGSILMACGNVTPSGSKVVISPNSVKWTVASSYTTTTGYYVINNFDILITDANDTPLNGMAFEARLDLAPNQSNPTWLQLLDKDNNPVVSPFKAKTDIKGSYRLGVNIPLGLEFKAVLYVSTGNAFQSADIEETIQ